jgi:WD40 repeat protein
MVEAAQTSDGDPRLVLEAGGHRAVIRALLFTADGRELVSVSDDKAIRAWSVSSDGSRTGLARTIRRQIEGGHGGQIATAALSPTNELNSFENDRDILDHVSDFSAER